MLYELPSQFTEFPIANSPKPNCPNPMGFGQLGIRVNGICAIGNLGDWEFG